MNEKTDDNEGYLFLKWESRVPIDSLPSIVQTRKLTDSDDYGRVANILAELEQ